MIYNTIAIIYNKKTMELPFDIWNKIYEQCKTFIVRRKLYNALPQSFKNQYPKKLIPDGDKSLLKYLSIDDEKEAILTLKISRYISSDVKPLEIKNLKIIYKNVPKTLDELFDFDKRIYESYLYILAYNQYKKTKGWKDLSTMNIDYELKMGDCGLSLITAITPISEMA